MSFAFQNSSSPYNEPFCSFSSSIDCIPEYVYRTYFRHALQAGISPQAALERLFTALIAVDSSISTKRGVGAQPPRRGEAPAPRPKPDGYRYIIEQSWFTESFLSHVSAPPEQSLLTRYRAGTETDRRQLLSQLAQAPLPQVTDISDRPTALDVEWFFTARKLCSLMAQVSDLPLTAVNPEISAEGWSKVAFKGGSEAGVVNLTHEFVSQSGKRYCVSATWNNPDAALDENQFLTLYTGMVAGLQEADR